MRYLITCLMIAIALAFQAPAWATPPLSAANPRGESFTGKVGSVSGPSGAEFIFEGKKRALRKGSVIKGGDGAQIKTGASTVELELGDLTTAIIEPNSDLIIRSLYFSRWSDQVVFFVNAGAIEIKDGTGIAHQAVAAVVTDRFQADLSNGQMRVARDGDKSTVSVTANEAAVKTFTTGLTEMVNSGYTKTIDSRGERTTRSGLARFLSLKTLLWLLVPLALFYRRRMNQKIPKYQARRGQKIKLETE